MANVHRALVALGDNLGMLANREMDREHERVMSMRQENLLRIQHSLQEQGRTADRAFESGERAKEREARATEVTTGQQFESEQRRLEREARATESAAERGLQREQIDIQQRQQQERDYLGRLNQIDSRIQELTDYQTQANAEGKVVDASYLSGVQQEIATLQNQKRTLAQERDIMLARGGDSRYRKLSPEEVSQLRGGKSPPVQMPGSDGQRQDLPVAAQAPAGGSTIKEPPRAPPKPAGIAEREAKASRKVVPPEQVEENRAASSAAIAGTAGRGARDVAGAVRAIGENLRSRKDEPAAVRPVKQALAAGQQPTQAQVQALAGVDPERLKGVYGFTDADLRQLGLK